MKNIIRNTQNNSLEETKLRHPPIFTGFEIFDENENGFFIINLKDLSIFKWIDVESLEENGQFFKESSLCKGGRRNFSYSDWLWQSYVETDDSAFKACVENFNGFYVAISRARKNSLGITNFGHNGELIDRITFQTANEAAIQYAVDFASEQEFTSALPCGAAMDCIYEEIFEKFRKEVQSFKEWDELEYLAWNRYEKLVRPDWYKDNCVYGLHDLFNTTCIESGEYTTEIYQTREQPVIRGGQADGLYLISSKKQVDCSAFAAGDRDFTYYTTAFANHGYRIVLLPQPV